MSKYHGEQYWERLRNQTLRSWRILSEDDYSTLRAMRHEREVRARGQRARARRYRQDNVRDLEI